MTVLGCASLADALESSGSTPKLTSHAPPELPPEEPDPIITLFGVLFRPTEFVINILLPLSRLPEYPTKLICAAGSAEFPFRAT